LVATKLRTKKALDAIRDEYGFIKVCV
jgi:hypothetical protein